MSFAFSDTLTICGVRIFIRTMLSPRLSEPSRLKIAQTRAHKIQKNVIGDIPPDGLSRDIVETEMKSGVDTTVRHFIRHCGKARIRARPAGRRAFPGVFERNVVAPEKQRENRRVRHPDR